MKRLFGSARIVLVALLAVLLLAYATLLPAISTAQEDTLSATIRASLLADPNASELSQSEIEALVEALSAEAREEGITAHDITWQPQKPESPSSGAESMCGRIPVVLCALNEAFGFSGGNLLIPLILLLASFALLFVITLMIKHGRHHAEAAPPSPPPSTPQL